MIGEVVDTKMAYKTGQTNDLTGERLPVGSILVQVLPASATSTAVHTIYARPENFTGRVPLVGEFVRLEKIPANTEYDQGKYKGLQYAYSQPLNISDSVTMNVQYGTFKRESPVTKVPRVKIATLTDKEQPGETFPSNPPNIGRMQPFEGDYLIEGRLGQSLRMSSTVTGNTSIYEKKPWWTGGSNGDPMMILKVKKSQTDKYYLENPQEDQGSIYLTSTQKLAKLKGGFDKNLDVKKLPTYGGGQVVATGDRVVINAMKDIAFFIGKTKAVITGKQVILQSSNHNVDLDDLMEYIKQLTSLCTDLATAKAQYATAAGPTAVATNSPQFVKHLSATFTQKFKQP